MSLHLFIIGFLLLFSLSAIFVTAKIGPLIVLQPHRITSDDYLRCTGIVSPADLHLPFDNLSVRTKDDVALLGWFVPAGSPAKGTIIYLHGVGDNKISGLTCAGLFHDHGYNVCLFDSRRHGESGGRFCTYGYYEKLDIVEIIDALEGSYGPSLGKIGLFGVSMGAAVALQSAAIENRIAAVIAEGCFVDLRSISVDHQKRIIAVRWKLISDLVMRRAERLAHFRVDEVSPLKALDSTLAPILFVHGTRDSVIDRRYSEVLYRRAKGPKELYLIQGAYHNDTWVVGGTEYEKKILSFFDRWLSSTDSTTS